jgi:sec-independent protein translocase protein TatC
MPILEHFEELRSRLLVALLFLLATTLASFAGSKQLLQLLTRPIGGLENLQAIEITESVSVFMRVALLSGVILAMPVIIYELLMFITPGLTGRERRWVIVGVPAATIMFASGVVFAYFILLPPAVEFLVSFMEIRTIPRLANYITFITGIMFWMGVAFQFPLIIFILAKIKIVNGK